VLRAGRTTGSKALFTLDATVKLKRDADVRNDEFHRLIDHFKKCVGKLAVIDDHAGRFESTNMNVVTQGFLSK
jgi:hypothetical protein